MRWERQRGAMACGIARSKSYSWDVTPDSTFGYVKKKTTTGFDFVSAYKPPRAVTLAPCTANTCKRHPYPSFLGVTLRKKNKLKKIFPSAGDWCLCVRRKTARFKAFSRMGTLDVGSVHQGWRKKLWTCCLVYMTLVKLYVGNIFYMCSEICKGYTSVF